MSTLFIGGPAGGRAEHLMKDPDKYSVRNTIPGYREYATYVKRFYEGRCYYVLEGLTDEDIVLLRPELKEALL